MSMKDTHPPGMARYLLMALFSALFVWKGDREGGILPRREGTEHESNWKPWLPDCTSLQRQ